MVFNPSRTIFPWTRWYFLINFVRICCSPLLNVLYRDTFIANQFTSLQHTMTDGAYLLCFETYGMGQMFTHASALHCTSQVNTYWFWLAAWPNFWRCGQCFRRYFTQGRVWRNFGNGLKYGNRCVVATLEGILDFNSAGGGASYSAVFALWVATSIFNVLFSFYWDVFKDWGLDELHIRAVSSQSIGQEQQQLSSAEKLTGSNKTSFFGSIRVECSRRLLLPISMGWIYLFSIAFDFVLRMVSLISVSPTIFFGSNFNAFGSQTILYIAESLRRSWWNFFRLENEHVTNASKFRELEAIPHHIIIPSPQNKKQFLIGASPSPPVLSNGVIKSIEVSL